MDKPYYVYQCTAVFPYSVLVEARDEEEAREKAYSLFRQDLRRGEVIHKDTFPAFNVTLCPLLTAVRFGRPYEAPEKKRKTYAEDFFSKYPDAPHSTKNGMVTDRPAACRMVIYGGGPLCITTKCDCAACWNEEMEADDVL